MPCGDWGALMSSGSELLVRAKTNCLLRLLREHGERAFVESLAKELLGLEGEIASMETEKNKISLALSQTKVRLEESERRLSEAAEVMHGCD